jgi:hypothetical protein
MDNKEKNRKDDYMTIEEIAVRTSRSSGTIRNLIKKLGILKVVLPGDNRERVARSDVNKIQGEIDRHSHQR